MDTSKKIQSANNDKLSFPYTENKKQDSEFEFGFILTQPYSPSSDHFSPSPADHLFLNGKLLPHSFPFQPPSINRVATIRTNSISSKDSFSMSSRSSSSGSARTSSSSSSCDSSERKMFLHNNNYNRVGSFNKSSTSTNKRWQYITQVPAAGLKRENSSRGRHLAPGGTRVMIKKGNSERKGGPLWRILRSFLLACRECHAMEPSN
ncbi:hypothetical protein ACFE04_022457 [Oxalis oulophora]